MAHSDNDMAGHDNFATPILLAVLGAGRASRFGGDKLAADCAGKPLGQWALDSALATGLPLVWVADATAPTFVGDAEVVLNRCAAKGIGTSVALAARIAAERGASALLVTLADMPLVNAALLGRLLDAGAPAACLHPNGKSGVPALLPASAFAALMALTGDQGAGRIIARMEGLSLIECEAAALFDVDTPGALAEAARLLNTFPASSS